MDEADIVQSGTELRVDDVARAIHKAVSAYRLARSSYLAIERDIESEHGIRLRESGTAEEGELARLREEYEQAKTRSTAEQQRAEVLAPLIHDVREAADRMITAIGYSYIVAQTPTNRPQAESETPAEQLSAALSACHLAQCDLYAAVFELARTLLQTGQPDEAESILGALSPCDAKFFPEDPTRLRVEALCRQASLALNRSGWDEAQEFCRRALSLDSESSAALSVLRNAVLGAAQKAIDADQWQEAEARLTAHGKTFEQDEQVGALLRRVRLQQAQLAVQRSQWENARAHLTRLLDAQPNDPEALQLLSETYPPELRDLLENRQWTHVQALVQQAMQRGIHSEDLTRFETERLYRQALEACEAGNWQASAQFLTQLDAIAPHYRDVDDWPNTRPALVWATRRPTRLQLGTCSEYLADVLFSPDGTSLLAFNWLKAGDLRLIDLQRHSELYKWNPEEVLGATFTSDGDLYGICPSTKEYTAAALHHLTSRKVILETDPHQYPSRATPKMATLSKDGKWLAVLFDVDHHWAFTELWNVERRAKTSVISVQSHRDFPYDCKFSPGGAVLAISSHEGLCLYSVPSGNRLRTLGVSGSEQHHQSKLSFSGDGVFIASGIHGTGRQNVSVWEVETGSLVKILPDESSIESVTLSSDGSLLASGSWDDGALRVWDLASGTEVWSFQGRESVVISVAFSPDARSLAVGWNSSAFEVWRTEG